MEYENRCSVVRNYSLVGTLFSCEGLMVNRDNCRLKWESITVQLVSCLSDLDSVVSVHTIYKKSCLVKSKPGKL